MSPRMRPATRSANGTTSWMHGLPLHPGAVGLRRLALVALERPGEVQRVAEAGAVADLLHGEVGEAQQPRGLEHDAVGHELLRRAARDVAERPRERGGRHAKRAGVVGGVMVAGEVVLEALGEAAVELDLGVVGVAALGPRVLVPAFDPQEQDREQVALELGAAGVWRARRLGLERRDDRLEAPDLALRDLDRLAAAAGEHPAGRRALRRAAEERLVAEAHRRADDVLRLREDVHLAAADERQRARADGERPAVEQVLAVARAQPEQLVVVVAVRRADVAGGETHAVEPRDLDGVARVGQAVDGERAVARGTEGGLAAHPPGCTRSAPAATGGGPTSASTPRPRPRGAAGRRPRRRR